MVEAKSKEIQALKDSIAAQKLKLNELQGVKQGGCISQEEVMQILMLGDLLNTEIGNIAFGVDEHYQWQLLELTFNANKLIF